MALSFCSNWAALDHLNPEMPPFHEHQSEVEEALLAFCDPFDPSHLLIDSLFDPPNDPFRTEAEANPQHCSHSDPSLLSLPPDLYQPYDELDFYQCPKRPRRCGNLYHPSDLMFEANSYDGAALGHAMSGGRRAPEFVTEFVLPPLPPVVGCNGGEKKADGGCLSAQSVAARERRKRISEKTQELGRLIPGGNKMNTAEMFHAASKYVKFLQAQIGILGMMGSIQGCKGSPHVEEQIQVLLESPAIQEKLYGDGRCMAPKEVVEALAEDKDIKSNLLVSRDLERFIKSMG